MTASSGIYSSSTNVSLENSVPSPFTPAVFHWKKRFDSDSSCLKNFKNWHENVGIKSTVSYGWCSSLANASSENS